MAILNKKEGINVGDCMSKTIDGFHHVAMKVKDFDEVVEFYTDGLGFKKGITWGNGDERAVMIDVGNENYIEIFAGGKMADENEGAFMHIALKSQDCEKDLNRAVKAGAVVTVKVMNVDIPSNPVKKVRIAFCKGLNGEILEFFQEL